jgi:hypothetical protein
MLVMPDDTPAHPYPVSIAIASLAPNAEVTVYPWKEPPELKARTINRVRIFLKAHQPKTAMRRDRVSRITRSDQTPPARRLAIWPQEFW